MIRIEHNEDNWLFPFVEYVPAGTAPTDKLPLILQLHGAGERGHGGEELARVDVHGFSKLVKDKEYPCRLVMPQCPTDTFWAAHVETLLVFLQQIQQAYRVDEERVYMTGLSMGGYGTWYVSMEAPALFAAIAPVCGGGMAWNAAALTMPVWTFHGVEDPTVSVTQTDEMVEALRRAGRDVTYSRLAGVGHNAWDYAYNDELMTWLLRHRRAD